jgi:hypothetical protein
VHWPQLEFLAEALRNAWPQLLHRVSPTGICRRPSGFDPVAGRCGGPACANCAPSVDAFYLDGFDPQQEPANVVDLRCSSACGQLAAPNATFATWCVAGQVTASPKVKPASHVRKAPRLRQQAPNARRQADRTQNICGNSSNRADQQARMQS